MNDRLRAIAVEARLTLLVGLLMLSLQPLAADETVTGSANSAIGVEVQRQHFFMNAPRDGSRKAAIPAGCSNNWRSGMGRVHPIAIAWRPARSAWTSGTPRPSDGQTPPGLARKDKRIAMN